MCGHSFSLLGIVRQRHRSFAPVNTLVVVQRQTSIQVLSETATTDQDFDMQAVAMAFDRILIGNWVAGEALRDSAPVETIFAYFLENGNLLDGEKVALSEPLSHY